MAFVAISCEKCGANLEVDEIVSTYTCRYCRTVHERDFSKSASPTPHSFSVMAERAIANSQFGKALQFVEQGLLIDPHSRHLLELEEKANVGLAALVAGHSEQTQEELKLIQDRSEAEECRLEAQIILDKIRTNIKVYGSNHRTQTPSPANTDLALQFIDRALELAPDSPKYLNLKALLLMEGKGMKLEAVELLEKAALINPRDIAVQNNLKSAKTLDKTTFGCFIATAAFGSPLAQEVIALRLWRDETLLMTASGRKFVEAYYWMSPPLARFISNRPALRCLTRWLLAPLIRNITKGRAFRRT